MRNKIIFGTDGWRGLLDEEINFDTVAVVAQAFADYLKERNQSLKAVIGYDGRKYSKEFAALFSEVLSGNDIEVLLADKVEPTPVVSFNAKLFNCCGVMITASHNPAKYNGIKFKAPYGGPFFTEETIIVENLLYKNPVKKNQTKVITTDIRTVYLNQLKSYINFEQIKKADFRVLIDSMSGAGQSIIQEFLEANDVAIADTIFGTPENDFSGRNAEPIEKNLTPLSDKLKNGNYAFGIATDGDADRGGYLLDTGEWLSAQETIILLVDYLVNKRKYSGCIIKTSSVTDKLKAHFSANHIIHDVQVGFKYICEKMIEEDTIFGCEESGGFGYKNHIPERDGILSGLIMIEMLASSGYTNLSDYLNEKKKIFGEIYYDRIDMHYDKEDRIEKLPNLYKNPPKEMAGFKIREIKEFYSSRGIINGLKLSFEGGTRWLLIRASETEPLIRIYSEGESNEEVRSILDSGKSLFN